ncbi:MAG: alpha/beta fold hydrolase [Candidatus Woesearchaeota archaeon]
MNNFIFPFFKTTKLRKHNINYLDTYAKRKKNNKNILLFIPGAGGCVYNWKHQIEFFYKKGYRVISYDPISQGQSDFVKDYNFDEHFKDFLALLDFLKIKENLILITHSSSTQIALRYIKNKDEYNGRLKKLVLISVSLKENDPFWWKLFISMPRFILNKIYKKLSKKTNLIHYLYFSKKTPRKIVVEFLNENNIPNIETLLIFKTYWYFDAEPWIKKCDIKTLILSGKEDILVKTENDIEVSNTFINSKLEFIEDAGHMCYYEKPDEVNKKINNFIK